MWGLMALVACADPPPTSDAALYTEAISEIERPSAERLALCDQIRGDEGRGDCQLQVASKAPHLEELDPDALCGRVDAGRWQHECWFQAAETWRRAGSPDRAQAACARSGPFEGDCAQHLWRTALYTLLDGQGSAAFPEILPEAERMYDEWAPRSGGEARGEGFDKRFWWQLYKDGFEQDRERGAPFDLAACAPLPAAHAGRCRHMGLRFYWTRLMATAPGLPGFCEAGLDELAATPGLEAAADPALGEAVARARGELCEGRR